MKKKIAIILLLISSLSLIGCQDSSTKKEESNKDKRFIVLCKEKFLEQYNGSCEIIRVKDKVTGEEFIIYNGYRKGGITKADKSNK